jgi:hypothetical protein
MNMSLNHKQLRERRYRLLKQDPHCFWCRKPVFYRRVRNNHGVLPHNFATIDHLNTRMHGKRPERGRLVLACHVCNQRRNKEEMLKNRKMLQWRCASLPWYLEPINIIIRVRNKHRKYVNWINVFYPLIWFGWKLGLKSEKVFKYLKKNRQ